MRPTRFDSAALALALAVLATQISGCRHHSTGPTADIRFVNAVADSDSVRLSALNHPVIDHAKFGSVTDYTSVPAGSYSVNGSAQDSRSQPYDMPPVECTIEEGHKYTGIAEGWASRWPHAHLQIIEDLPSEQVPEDKAAIRVVDAYPHTAKLDIILNNIVAFHGLTYGTRCKAIELPESTYVGKAIALDNYDDPIAGPSTLDLDGGHSYELVVFGSPSDRQPGMVLLPDD